MPLSEVPAELQRRALRRLEELRNDGWETATLAPFAVALLRPDVEGIAYYEFSVLDAKGHARGYIITSTGEHDSPLPLVAQSGSSPSTRLRKMSAVEPSRYYMIDDFTFVAEGKSGELLSKIGNLPSQPATQSVQRRVEGSLRGTDWASWNDLKRDYADAYAEPLEDSAEQILKAWDTENDLTDYGEALAVGAQRWLPALEPDVEKLALAGAGASLIQVKQTERGPGDVGFAIKMIDEPAETASVALQVTYGSGRQETVNFGLASNAFLDANGLHVDKADPYYRQNPRPCGRGVNNSCHPRVTTSRQAYYPEVDATDGTLAQQLAVAQSQQAWYAQLDEGDDYNPYDCASGCAGTAWAMLMAWVDNRAEDPTSQFAGDWGIYRKSLSETGINQVAPLWWNDGAKRLVGAVAGELDGGRTFCLFNDARATAPSAMSKVKGWLQDRSDLNLHVAWENDFESHGKYIELAETEVIDNNRPAVVGFGKLFSSHYALLYGVEFIHQIVVSSQVSRNTETVNWRLNMGWGGGEKGDIWSDRNAWFVGRISPKDEPEDDTGHAIPAVCTNNAERNQACPAGQTGTKRQRCIDGQWRTDSNTCKRVGVGSGTGGNGQKEP